MDWEKGVAECLREVRFDRAKKARFNGSQCDNLCRAFVGKLAKFCTVGWPAAAAASSPSLRKIRANNNNNNNNSEICKEESDEKAKIVQRAWKEVYRVIREADVFLQACSGPDWWKKSATLAATGEAHAIHIHDLLWCVLGLDLSILQSETQGSSSESNYNAVCCRRLGEFGGEMTSPLRIHQEYVDKKQLASALQGVWREYGNKNALIRMMPNKDEENKARLAGILAERLQASIQTEPGLTELTVPGWFRIDPRDLKRRNTSVGNLDGEALFEGSWLGIKVGLKQIFHSAQEFFEKEAAILTRLQSPFVVQLFGVCKDEDRSYLVMEMISSNLERFLEDQRRRLPLHVGLDIMLQISRGMEYLHSQRIAHTDLKSSNVFIEPSSIREFRDEGHGRAKIFHSKVGFKPNNSQSCRYSHWMAPEAVGYASDGEATKQCRYKADVYSFAMICSKILTGERPFESVPYSKLHTAVMQGQRPVLPSCCPSPLSDYINKCWDADPSRRPHFPEISNFLRYMKLLILRIQDPQKTPFWSVCRQFDRKQINRCFEGRPALRADERVTTEEEALIIRALDGDFPESFRTLPRISMPLPPRRKYGSRFLLLRRQDNDLVRLPAYIRKYSYEELQRASSGFDLRIAGFCDSSSVWKAILHDQTHVAIKLVDRAKSENFRNEATVLAQLHHPNIIRLRGVCVSCSSCFLVYDYMAMGSLDRRLFGAAPGDHQSHQNHVLNWIMRRRIALGIARGLAHLHFDTSDKFLGVKIDATDVLLDERFTAKLCGFGMARPAGGHGVAGGNTWLKKSEQEDEEVANVYSFGVVLLEILTGCRCIDTPFSEYYCLHEAVHGIGSKSVLEFVDHRLRDEIDEKEAKNVINLGLWCIMKDPSLRPNMSQAVLVMEGLLQLCAPPLGRMEILPPPLRSQHFFRYQRAHVIDNSNAD